MRGLEGPDVKTVQHEPQLFSFAIFWIVCSQMVLVIHQSKFSALDSVLGVGVGLEVDH